MVIYAGGPRTDGSGTVAPASHLPQWEESVDPGWQIRAESHQGRQDLRNAGVNNNSHNLWHNFGLIFPFFFVCFVRFFLTSFVS